MEHPELPVHLPLKAECTIGGRSWWMHCLHCGEEGPRARTTEIAYKLFEKGERFAPHRIPRVAWGLRRNVNKTVTWHAVIYCAPGCPWANKLEMRQTQVMEPDTEHLCWKCRDRVRRLDQPGIT